MENLLDLKTQKSLLAKNNKSVKEAIGSLLDANSFVEMDTFLFAKSELLSEDTVGEGVVTGYGTVDGNPVYVYAQNFDVLKGGLGESGAKKILKCMRAARKAGVPIISILNSQGARLLEGATALNGYAEIIAESVALRECVTQVAIVKGECFGQISYLTALSDFVYMLDDAAMLTGAPQVIAANSNVTLSAKEIGGADVHFEKTGLCTFRAKDMKDVQKQLTKLFGLILSEYNQEADESELNKTVPAVKGYDISKLVSEMFDKGTMIELAPKYADCTITAIGRVGGAIVGILATNSEYICEHGLYKATRFVKLLEAYGISLVTLVNTKGLKTDVSKEQGNIVRATSSLMAQIASAEISKFSVVCGEATGMVFTALASKGLGFDYCLATENAVISPISIGAGTAIVYADVIKDSANSEKVRAEAEKKYAAIDANPILAAQNGVVDNIIPASAIKQYIITAMQMVD